MDSYEVKLMCSYDGTIEYLEPNKKISYNRGHTKILYVDRNINLSAMLDKLRKICNDRVSEFKYQFPGKDDNVVLITVHGKDDLENMMREYDKLSDDSNTAPVMRLFISKYGVFVSSDQCGLPFRN